MNASYASRVSDEIERAPSSVQIDDVSLKAFIESDHTVRELGSAMAKFVGAPLTAEPVEKLQRLTNQLHSVGLTTIEQLDEAISSRKKLIFDQWCVRMRQRVGSFQSLYHGIAIFHLIEVILAEDGDLQKVVEGLAKLGISFEPVRLHAAREILDAVNISKTRKL